MVLLVRYDISCGVSCIVSPGRNGFRFRRTLPVSDSAKIFPYAPPRRRGMTRRVTPMTEAGAWTDERVELLKKLWNDGLSASQIAAELGNVTRNAVIGKVHRLGLSGRAKNPGSAAPRPRKPAARAPSHPGTSQPSAGMTRGNTALAPQFAAEIEAEPEAEREPAPSEEVVVPFSERVTIMDLREYMCRWPMGDPTTAEFRFCGGRSQTGLPYCSYHARIAYQPAADRRRDRKRA
jgi:GcrA cell cycle regulator